MQANVMAMVSEWLKFSAFVNGLTLRVRVWVRVRFRVVPQKKFTASDRDT
jgi:hypothetical protein